MSARIVGVFLATCLFVSLCGLIAPVAGTPIEDGQLEDHAETESIAIEESNRSADRPFAEAGLDRTVSVGETVYLDTYGSRAAEGSLVAFEWRIERPDETNITPACSTCELTEFRPTQTGQYNVTVTVEDDAGRTASDTMYVTVLDEPAPDASLTGPAEIRLNDTAQIDLTASASTGELAAVEWYTDGDYREGQFLETHTFADTLDFSPDTVGKHSISAVVRNDNGTARRVRHELVARETASFEVEITDAPREIETGDDYNPEITVTNTGSITDTQTISLDIRGGPGVVDSETITLDPGESTTLGETTWRCLYRGSCPPSLSWFTSSYDAGSYIATAESETHAATTPLDVAEPPEPAYFDVEIVDADTRTINRGRYEVVNADIRVTNTGDKSDRQSIEYSTATNPSSFRAWSHVKWFSLNGGETETYSFQTGSTGGGASKFHLRSDDDEETTDLNSAGGGGGSSGSSTGSTAEIRFDADDVEVGEFATATVTSVEDRTGSTWSDPTNYISSFGDITGFAFRDLSVFGASGAVSLRGEPLGQSEGTRDDTIRYKGVAAGTGELAGDIWADSGDENLATDDESDTFDVEPEGGGGGGGGGFSGQDNDDENSGTGGFDDTVEFP